MTILGLLAVVALIAANGYFVAAEFAFVSARRVKLEEAAAAGDRRAQRAVAVLRRLSFMLSGAQLGITVTSLVVGFIAEPVFVAALQPVLDPIGVPDGAQAGVAVTAGFIISTMAQMVFGELAPKNLAIARPEPLARALAASTLAFMKVAAPLIRLFDGAANRLLRAVGIEPVEELHGAVSVDELDYIVGESANQGSLSADQADLLSRAIDFRDLTAHDAMVPRPRVHTIAADATCDTLRDLLATSHSRFPVVLSPAAGAAGDEVVGVVQAKDLLDVPADRWATTGVATLMREPVAVPDSARLPAVLALLRASATSIALVVDEHGADVGIITIEDILEELVGEIADEHDVVTTELEEVSPRSWRVPGAWRLDELERATGLVLPEGDYDTLGGLVMARLGQIPEQGDQIEVDGVHLTVLDVDRRAVGRLEVSVPVPEAPDGTEGARHEGGSAAGPGGEGAPGNGSGPDEAAGTTGAPEGGGPR